jgi:DNA polymerase-3 subunit delta'
VTKHPRQTTDLIGHAAAEARMVQALAAGRMPHAWLITGLGGIGKATLAYRLARFFLSGLPAGADLATPPDTTASKLIMAGSHPDLLVIERLMDDKKGKMQNTIPVDEVRRIAPFLRLTSSQGRGRVAIVDGAGALNRNGQNALLKILEEPPENSLLLLTAENASILLPTIRSRCRVLHLEALSETDLRALAERAGMALEDEAVMRFYLTLSGGSAARLIRYGACEADNAYARWCSFLATPGNIHQRLKLAEGWASKQDEDMYVTAQDIMLGWVQRLIADKARGKAPSALLEVEKPLAEGLYPGLSLASLMALWDNLKAQADEAGHANLDHKAALLGMLNSTAAVLTA